jgi:tetratricopeptide (TPR) repeat protein
MPVLDTPPAPDRALPPEAPRSPYLEGLLLLRDGLAAQAAEHLARMVALQPAHAGARVNLVRALLASGQPAAALVEADAALGVAPDHAELYFARGTALNALGQPDAARAALERAVAFGPSHAPSWLNLGNACADLNDFVLAEQYIRTALQCDRTLAEAYASLGHVLTALGRLEEAVAACDAAIALRPNFAQAHWNLAVAALLAGDFTRGFGEYEWRKRHDRFRRDFIDLPGPVWQDGDPAGRTILVHAEQGLGDTIQFARYLPLIAARGHAVLACAPPLIPLLATLPDVTVVPKQSPLPRYDAWIDQMSLPRVFRTRPETIPAATGYLRADPVRVAAWRDRLPRGSNWRITVGLAWAGNPAHSNDQRRSLPYAALQPVLAMPGVRCINLQVGEAAKQAALPDLSPLLTDYAETAALIANLDLLVTVDTSVAHVAGALGVPCWVMLPFAPDWRWMLGRNDSPWYAAVRLFRQERAGDWDAVVGRIAAALPQVAGASVHRPLR